MMEMTPSELFTKINGPLLREQRMIISQLTAVGRQPVWLTARQVEVLEGLSTFLDYVADIAHDQFGVDCLLTEGTE